MVDKHPRSGGIGSRVRFKGQLPSSVGLRCSSNASENPLGVILDKAVLEQRLRFGIYRRVDPQSKTAQDLIDWHKVIFFLEVVFDGEGRIIRFALRGMPVASEVASGRVADSSYTHAGGASNSVRSLMSSAVLFIDGGDKLRRQVRFRLMPSIPN